MAIYVSGSIAFDRIMTFPGQFEDHILPEKLHILNVSFLIDRVEEKRGGTGGNIAYSLALLGETPRLYGCVGRDFDEYAKAMNTVGVNLDGVRRLEETFTACCYITTDRKGNQITGFSPAAMNTPCDPAYYPKGGSGDWAIVAPGNVQDMVSLPEYFRAHSIPFIFDPGQQVIALSGEQLRAGLEGASCLIGNDYEVEVISKKTGLSKAELIQQVGYLIVTLGEQGSEVNCRDWEKARYIKAVPVQEVLDPTGAGDAYRAGLLKGLHSGLDVEVSAELGSVCSSFAIEKYGTQEHSMTKESFSKRYESAYGPMPALVW